MLLFKLPASSEHLSNPSFQLPLHNAHQISRSMDEIEVHEDSIQDGIDKLQHRVQSNANSIPLKKKILRINYYPNMLADFD